MQNNNTLEFKVYNTGYCIQKECFAIKGGQNKIINFPASCVLIKHPVYGYILFDTGYSLHFYEAVLKFPYSMYEKITPVFGVYPIKEQLEKDGIRQSEIKYIIISHFHADHISGLRDFSSATFLCHRKAYLKIKGKKGFSALKHGFLPDLLPKDFDDRLQYIKNKKTLNVSPFFEGYDVFCDGSIFAVELPGHAKGQIGILFNDLFFVADGCWSIDAYMKNIPPSEFVLNILGNKKEYKKTLKEIHDFYISHPETIIVPAHSKEALRRFNV